MAPHLFGLEVKQGNGRATMRQLSRLVRLRHHKIHAWIVRSPDEAVHIINATLEGYVTAFNDDLLAELDAALAGRPATGEVEAPVEPEAVPEFNFEPLSSPYTEEHHKAVETVMGMQEQATADQNEFDLANGTAVLAEAAETIAEENTALERIADGLEALVLEIRMLNTNITSLEERISAPEKEIAQTAAAPAPRRATRTKRGDYKLTPETPEGEPAN